MGRPTPRKWHMSINNVGVVGCGLMGRGSRRCAPEPGWTSSWSSRARQRPTPAGTGSEGRSSGPRRARQDRVRGRRARPDPGGDHLEELADRELVVEAIVEDEGAKTELFAALDKIVDVARRDPGVQHVVDPDHEARRGHRPTRATSSASTSSTRCRCSRWSSWCRPCSPPPRSRAGPRVRPGPARQAGHRLPGPGRLRGQRAADPVRALGDPDAGVRVRDRRGHRPRVWCCGAAHPQGPLALADLIGLDTTKAVAESLYEEFKEPLYAAPPLLNRMVDAGLLGRKTGRGFYTY